MKKSISTVGSILITLSLLLSGCASGNSVSSNSASSNSASSNSASSNSANGSSASSKSANTTSASANSSSKNKEDTISFAVVGPMTGEAAAEGEQQEKGVALAVKEINANGGINGKQLAYDVFDDQRSTDQSIICAEKIVAAKKYRFVIAPTSTGCSKASYPTYAQADIPLLSGSNTGNDITEQGFTNYMRVSSRDYANVEELADYMVNTVGIKNPAILHTSADTDILNAKHAQEYFKTKYGITVNHNEEFEEGNTKDFATYITNFKNDNVDGTLMLCEYNPCGLYLKQKYTLGFNTPVFTTSGCANPLLFQVASKEATNKDTNGGLFTLAAFDASAKDERTQKFVADYKEISGGVSPGEWAAGAYDVIYVMANALKGDAANLKGNDLVEWVRKNTDYDGIMVKVKGFDEKGDNPEASCNICEAVDENFVIVQKAGKAQ